MLIQKASTQCRRVSRRVGFHKIIGSNLLTRPSANESRDVRIEHAYAHDIAHSRALTSTDERKAVIHSCSFSARDSGVVLPCAITIVVNAV